MNIELFRSLVLVVWLTGSAILLGCLLGSWIQHVSRNEAQFRRKPKWTGRSKIFWFRRISLRPQRKR
jgi:hypothetical protein